MSKPEQPRVMREVEAAVKTAMGPVVGVEKVSVSVHALMGVSLFVTVEVSIADQVELSRWLVESNAARRL